VTLPATRTPTPTGREARLEALFAEHGRGVWAYARRRTSAADADEVVSETFLVAWRRLDDVPADPRPWLLGVARRCLANLERGQHRRTALEHRLATEPAATDPPDLDVHRALERLSAKDRELLTLLAWDELTPEEAAVVLGCSRSTVYVRLHRARRRLADLLPTLPEDAP
jgi:RNA polymerase sigma-70 factor (ECF subfamily)